MVEGGLGRDLQGLVEEFEKDVEVSGIFLEFHERDTVIGLTYCRRDELAQSLGVLGQDGLVNSKVGMVSFRIPGQNDKISVGEIEISVVGDVYTRIVCVVRYVEIKRHFGKEWTGVSLDMWTRHHVMLQMLRSRGTIT